MHMGDGDGEGDDKRGPAYSEEEEEDSVVTPPMRKPDGSAGGEPRTASRKRVGVAAREPASSFDESDPENEQEEVRKRARAAVRNNRYRADSMLSEVSAGGTTKLAPLPLKGRTVELNPRSTSYSSIYGQAQLGSPPPSLRDLNRSSSNTNLQMPRQGSER